MRSARINVPLDVELWEALVAYGRRLPDPLSGAATVRRLIRLGLQAEGEKVAEEREAEKVLAQLSENT